MTEDKCEQRHICAWLSDLFEWLPLNLEYKKDTLEWKFQMETAVNNTCVMWFFYCSIHLKLFFRIYYNAFVSNIMQGVYCRAGKIVFPDFSHCPVFPFSRRKNSKAPRGVPLRNLRSQNTYTIFLRESLYPNFFQFVTFSPDFSRFSRRWHPSCSWTTRCFWFFRVKTSYSLSFMGILENLTFSTNRRHLYFHFYSARPFSTSGVLYSRLQVERR